MAITHTHNYYITPLDKAPSNKRLKNLSFKNLERKKLTNLVFTYK